jgi:phenylacetate-CoA ligase
MPNAPARPVRSLGAPARPVRSLGAPVPPVRSSVPGLVWPALPPAAGQSVLSALFQLEQSQWWTSETLWQRQSFQLAILLEHARTQVPWYREHARRIEGPLTPEAFRQWPILGKETLRHEGSRFNAQAMPQGHGNHHRSGTTGSTGVPVQLTHTDVSVFFQQVLNLRHVLWHRLDLNTTFAALRVGVKPVRFDDWGLHVSAAFASGPAVGNDSSLDVAEQLRWLMTTDASYLQSYPSNLRALLQEAKRAGLRPPKLRALIAFGETVSPELRTLATEVWSLPVIDMYSCNEFGMLAIQAPETGGDATTHYLVQETNLVEVLREDGSPCQTGEIGRVVVTGLTNFAQPLVRYELGDYAEVGPPDPAGRGLMTLKRIHGRVRNMATDPTGRRFWPSFAFNKWRVAEQVTQMQFRQTAPDTIEVRYRAAQALSEADAAELRAELTKSMGYAFNFPLVRVSEPLNGPGGKFEDFIGLG